MYTYVYCDILYTFYVFIKINPLEAGNIGDEIDKWPNANSNGEARRKH